MPSKRPIIAILGGTGKEGSALALRWASAGYKILVGSRQVEKALVTADRINTQVAKNMVSGLENRDAARQAEICVLTIVYTAHRQALESVKADLSGKILVDTTTRVDFRDPRPPKPPCAAQEAQNLLGSSVRVVAAFQSVPAKSLLKNIQQPMDADVLVCSDNIPAADEVIQLAQAAGMRGYYAGDLANAIVVEGLTSILISMNKHYGVNNTSVRITGITVDR